MKSRTTDLELATLLSKNPSLSLARKPQKASGDSHGRVEREKHATPKPSVNGARQSKYRNQKTEVDGILFDSKKEAARWSELKILDQQGAIASLKRQVEYKLYVNGTKACSFVADFVYMETGRWVVEDVKSEITRKNRAYRIKVKLIKAIHGIEIKET